MTPPDPLKGLMPVTPADLAADQDAAYDLLIMREDLELLRKLDVSRNELVTLVAEVLDGPLDHRGFVTLAEGARRILDDERARTDVDEWDESDPRCFAMNAAYEFLGL